MLRSRMTMNCATQHTASNHAERDPTWGRLALSSSTSSRSDGGRCSVVEVFKTPIGLPVVVDRGSRAALGRSALERRDCTEGPCRLTAPTGAALCTIGRSKPSERTWGCGDETCPAGDHCGCGDRRLREFQFAQKRFDDDADDPQDHDYGHHE